MPFFNQGRRTWHPHLASYALKESDNGAPFWGHQNHFNPPSSSLDPQARRRVSLLLLKQVLSEARATKERRKGGHDTTRTFGQIFTCSEAAVDSDGCGT